MTPEDLSSTAKMEIWVKEPWRTSRLLPGLGGHVPQPRGALFRQGEAAFGDRQPRARVAMIHAEPQPGGLRRARRERQHKPLDPGVALAPQRRRRLAVQQRM